MISKTIGYNGVFPTFSVTHPFLRTGRGVGGAFCKASAVEHSKGQIEHSDGAGGWDKVRPRSASRHIKQHQPASEIPQFLPKSWLKWLFPEVWWILLVIGGTFPLFPCWTWGSPARNEPRSPLQGMIMFINEEKVCEVPGTAYHTLPSQGSSGIVRGLVAVGWHPDFGWWLTMMLLYLGECRLRR